MASFLSPNKSVVSTSGNIILPGYSKVANTLHYNNHPESLTTAAFGDATLGNKYLNRVDITGSDGEVRGFASYANSSGRTLGFGWQFYNAGSSAVTLTIKRLGFGDSFHQGAWEPAIIKPWRDYWATYLGTTVSVPAGGVYWIRWDNMVPTGYIFCALSLVEASGPLCMFAYVYEALSNINGTATHYLWSTDPTEQYSGKGFTNYIYTDRTTSRGGVVNVNQLPGYFDFTGCDGSWNLDMIPIYDVEENIWFKCDQPTPRNNIGNWGASYHHRMTFVNNTASTVTVQGWIGSNGYSSTYVHIVQCNNDGLYLVSGEMWHFVDVTLAAGASETVEFLVNKGTNGNGVIRCYYKLV